MLTSGDSEFNKTDALHRGSFQTSNLRVYYKGYCCRSRPRNHGRREAGPWRQATKSPLYCGAGKTRRKVAIWSWPSGLANLLLLVSFSNLLPHSSGCCQLSELAPLTCGPVLRTRGTHCSLSRLPCIEESLSCRPCFTRPPQIAFRVSYAPPTHPTLSNQSYSPVLNRHSPLLCLYSWTLFLESLVWLHISFPRYVWHTWVPAKMPLPQNAF